MKLSAVIWWRCCAAYAVQVSDGRNSMPVRVLNNEWES
jgi:hypothetical protein